jgi:hypothetical protein
VQQGPTPVGNGGSKAVRVLNIQARRSSKNQRHRQPTQIEPVHTRHLIIELRTIDRQVVFRADANRPGAGTAPVAVSNSRIWVTAHVGKPVAEQTRLSQIVP